MKNPQVSILMPVYNGEDYLKQAINSILNQSYTNFELVIVNDGSTDRTQEIIDAYNDKRIVPVIQENQGVARSLNNGLKKARGKYVRRHDADDISSKDSLKKQIDFLESRPDYVMVCNQQAFMTANGHIAWKYKLPNDKYFGNKPYRDLTPGDFRRDASSPVVHGTACYRRKEVMDAGAYRPEFIVSEDNDLWMRLLEKYKIAVLNECTYHMRIHPGSATNRHAEKIQYFRDRLQDFAEQRKTRGTDPIMRGENMPPLPKPKGNQEMIKKCPRGKHFREDLGYFYALALNARDLRLTLKTAGEILRDGWKDRRTYKLLLFPVLGKQFVGFGVKIKSFFKT
ncbi:MAG: glycosyltransferase family 2 protein [Bacteroidales bacterium]